MFDFWKVSSVAIGIILLILSIFLIFRYFQLALDSLVSVVKNSNDSRNERLEFIRQKFVNDQDITILLDKFNLALDHVVSVLEDCVDSDYKKLEFIRQVSAKIQKISELLVKFNLALYRLVSLLKDSIDDKRLDSIRQVSAKTQNISKLLQNYISFASDRVAFVILKDSDDYFEFGGKTYREYNGACWNLVKKLLIEPIHKSKTPGNIRNVSLFVPISIFNDFVKVCILPIREWDYDLQIDNEIHPMKLVWCEQLPKDLERDPNIKKSFSFLQQNYLRYMDKPFWNSDVITLVNLVLDYHRTQKRQRGIEIFNIFDLIAFKMAIDDNRVMYENCEFHKLIDHTLGEIIQPGTKFNLDQYKYATGYYAAQEMVDYLVYHFQETIRYIYWSDYYGIPNKLSNITNVPAYLNFVRRRKTGDARHLFISEVNSEGKCAEVLYDLILKCKEELKLCFELDSEWIYSGLVGLLNETTEPLANCKITIETKNSFHFIENFINWLKLSFGDQCQKIKLTIRNFENINLYIFNNFRLGDLIIDKVKLDHNLIKKFKKSKWLKADNYSFFNCRIVDDINERFEFIRQEDANGENIFKLLDELENDMFINLTLEEHTIGTLLAYVASVMKDKNLNQFEFKNRISLTNGDFQLDFRRFLRSDLNPDIGHIEVLSPNCDFYEFLNGRKFDQSNRDDYDFYN